VYLPDTLAIASFYKEWFKRGEGLGNFLCYGDLPATNMRDRDSFLFPPGVILDRDLSRVHEIDMHDKAQIQEYVAHSWYNYSTGKETGLHPYDGETQLDYTGPEPPFKQLQVEDPYSWIKSPRWRDKAMEVGPLSRVLLLYASGHEPTRELARFALAKLDLPIIALFSTLGRTAARTLESKLLADAMQGWFDDLVSNIKRGDTRTFNEALWDPSTWPETCQGAGFMEAPRGALGHWVVIRNGKIANYQAVVPSTWNAGPRDASGQSGAYEAALQDQHTLVDSSQPLEILRTIHSFDPCIACAVHLADEAGDELIKIQISG
ncbi:MAG: nickel-dependent hydrogenase large subunit, partial [Gammaproteobacteria bacterium]|nr:nickel-dependent hydrogenase large subunit [Gammaproteobacteria bacterium]